MYLRGSVWLVSVDVSCFLPYEGAANCTLYFLLDLQFYLISDLLCDNADIDPLWFLGGAGRSFFLFFFSLPDASCEDFSCSMSDFSTYACRT